MTTTTTTPDPADRAAELLAAGYCPTDCGASIKFGMLMCRPCWREVPAHLQREVSASWRARQRALGDPPAYEKATQRHEQAKAAAIAAVA